MQEYPENQTGRHDYERDLREKVLPVLRCVACGSADLKYQPGAAGGNYPGGFWAHTLRCMKCSESYPVTEDFIPVVWSAGMRRHFSGEAIEDEALAANIDIYEKFSDDYQKTIRVDHEIPKRMSNAVLHLSKECGWGEDWSELYFVDFGCGPGHVLAGLGDTALRRIGLDVSPKNLRNARRSTGAMAVCGDATNMPFADGSVHAVTGSAILHHLTDWRRGIEEACRVCAECGGVVIDSEPSREHLSWGPLARLVWRARKPIFKLMSPFSRSKFVFKRDEDFRRNLVAEIHNLPGRGFSTDELESLFGRYGFDSRIICSPTTDLEPRGRPGWKLATLHLLSGHNPWNPKYGTFMAIAKRRS